MLLVDCKCVTTDVIRDEEAVFDLIHTKLPKPLSDII